MYFKIFLVFIAAVLFSCHIAEQDSDDDHHQMEDDHVHDDHGDGEDHIAFTPTQIENIGLVYGKLRSQNIQSTVQLTGRVELPPSGKAIVGSALEGKIVQVHVEAGEYVQKGQKLFTLQNLEVIDWQQQLEQERSELAYLEKDLVRQKDLADRSLAPVKNYEVALSKKQQTAARLKAHVSKLEAIGITGTQEGEYQSTFNVLAPHPGIIQHLMVSNGAYIHTSTALAEIINNQKLHLHLLAYGDDIVHLEKGQVLNFYVQSRPDDLMEARIFWINDMVNAQNNSYDVHAEILGNISALSPGEFAEARVINQEREVLVLPNEAVTYDKGLHYIFAVDAADNKHVYFRKLHIRPGVTDLGFTEILPIDPLPENADYVIEGAFFIMAESKKGDESMSHSH